MGIRAGGRRSARAHHRLSLDGVRFEEVLAHMMTVRRPGQMSRIKVRRRWMLVRVTGTADLEAGRRRVVE